jgi:hypothetical protein
MRPKTRYGRRRGEGVKTSLRVAIKHGWKSSMNITPWDYLDRELIRLKRQAMPALVGNGIGTSCVQHV